MTTAGAAAVPKYLRVAAAIRRQIADGTLRPGQPAPSGAELSRASGFSTLTCRKALRALIAAGLLVPGPSPNARPRVADPQAPVQERDLANATRALSAGLAARRHAAGLTQAELAALAHVSVTTVGHAETGRTWQSRLFWERADAALHAAGALLRLHDAYRAASSPQQDQRSTPDFFERTLPSAPTPHAPAPWPTYTVHPFLLAPAQSPPHPATPAELATPPDAARLVAPQHLAPQHLTPQHLDPQHLGPSPVGPSPVGPSPVGPSPASMSLLGLQSLGPSPVAPSPLAPSPAGLSPAGPSPVGSPSLGWPPLDSPSLASSPAGEPPVGSPSLGPSPVGPSRIIIVWTDGTVTTVHAPEVLVHLPVPAPRDLDR